MHKRGIIYRLRATLAGLLGIRSEAANKGAWWEIDLILIMLIGVFAVGVLAFSQL